MKTIEKYRHYLWLAVVLSHARTIRNRISLFLRRKKTTPRLPIPIVNGVPPGIERDLVNQICIDEFGSPVEKISYLHLSGWKPSGAFRLHLALRDGRDLTVIYKDAVYDRKNIPALNGLPVRPGPPEYFLYKKLGQSNLDILPEVFFMREMVPLKHYQYLLEDVSRGFRNVLNLQDKMRLAVGLQLIHRKFCDESTAFNSKVLIQYDHQFSLALQEYARENLKRYALARTDPEVEQFLVFWPKVVEVHGSREFHEMSERCLIHGDFNFTNIFIGRENPDQIKLIDWEWTGLGYLHADLASILKGTPETIEAKALDLFSRENPQLTFQQHARLYYWCKLERNLLDAAFLAVHELDSDHPADFSIPAFIHNSLHQMLSAYQKLI